jgi:orotidine-5'-phosphate decarboxylase
MMHVADRLLSAVQRCGAPLCVGLDPVVGKLPAALQTVGATKPASAIESFSLAVLAACARVAPVVKIQSACYERYGVDGMKALATTLDSAREHGFEVILDAKRGDIGISAEHYAAAAFEAAHADWVTVNAYLGADGLAPFVKHEHGAFALVRTSNPGGDALQSLRLGDGRSVAEAVADLVADAGKATIGGSGYSSLGAVVGATKPADAARLRGRMPHTLFLVPGYGAQGGGIADIKPCFNADGRGAIITASRSIIYPFATDDADWAGSIRRAAEATHRELSEGLRA